MLRWRRYNALVYVPYQLERLLLFGVLLCFDSFLVRGVHFGFNQGCTAEHPETASPTHNHSL